MLTFIREEMPEAFPRERAMISPRLADFDFSDAFDNGDARSRPVPAGAHS